MSLILPDLSPDVRQAMLDEITSRISDNSIYVSPRLSDQGRREYPALLTEAATNCDDSWLATELAKRGRLNQVEQRRKPSGGFIMVKVPYTASETLAEGEFNRFYISGLCRYAIKNNIFALVVYRAKFVDRPRPESEEKIGTFVDPQTLLADLRNNVGLDTILGIPAGPNSGLSVRLPPQN
jgi:hypothetical protein